jgi:hypothetical protein
LLRISQVEQTKLRRRAFIGAYVLPEQRRQLVERARREERSVSSVIRKAVVRELERKEQP